MNNIKTDSSTVCWNKYADTWISHAQTNDYRLHFIMPFTLEKLGAVSGKNIIDIGCGEGGYSRELAKRGANVTAVDCAQKLVEYGKEKAKAEGLEINYFVRNSGDLFDIAGNNFDIALSSMMLMDCEDFDGTVKEMSKVVKTGGRLFISVLHPCFYGKTTKRKGKKIVIENYFEPAEWVQPMSKAVPAPIIFRHRTLQDYVKCFCKHGLQLTDLHEPIPTDEQLKKSPIRFERLKKRPLFIFFELVKA